MNFNDIIQFGKIIFSIVSILLIFGFVKYKYNSPSKPVLIENIQPVEANKHEDENNSRYKDFRKIAQQINDVFDECITNNSPSSYTYIQTSNDKNAKIENLVNKLKEYDEYLHCQMCHSKEKLRLTNQAELKCLFCMEPSSYHIPMEVKKKTSVEITK